MKVQVKDPVNWYVCNITETEHAGKIAGLAEDLDIHFELLKTDNGMSFFIHNMYFSDFADLVNVYTTVNQVTLTIDCRHPETDACKIKQPVPVPQGKARTTRTQTTMYAAARLESGAIIINLTDGKLTASRITWIDWGGILREGDSGVKFKIDHNTSCRVYGG